MVVLDRAHSPFCRESPDLEDATNLHRSDAVEAAERREGSIPHSVIGRHVREQTQGLESRLYNRPSPDLDFRSQFFDSVESGK